MSTTNVIRQDVVQLDFEIEGFKELQKMQDEINALKKMLTGGIGEDALDDLKDKANESVKPLKKVKEQAEKVTKSVTDIGKKAATVAFNGLKKLAGISFKALTVGIAGAATAIGGLVYQSVSAYAEFEQLSGGVETLFKKDAATVQKYANDAFKTAGLSANDYMNTVTSFSASLISSVGGDTKKAAELANTAIIDMSDNANKMGTDMGSLQYAYQGFAKQNYTMLDNLKLGYGGTKSEMERLIKDAAKLDKSVDANSMSYANIVKAIHAVQKNMDIMGTTQKEAEKTITGSLNMMKSAWGNLMPALIQGGDSFDQCLENLIYSVDKFADNVMPAIEKALGGVGTLIEKLVPKFTEKFPEYAEMLLPPLIKAAVDLTKGLIKALPSIVKTVAVTIVDIFGEQFPIIGKIAGFFEENAGKIATAIKKIVPVVLGLVAAFKLLKGVKAISSIFSGFGGAGGTGGAGGGITGIFTSLAKANPKTILKGMGNLAIILGGLSVLTAAFMFVAPFIAQLSDVKSIVKVLAVLTALGLLGSGLAALAGVVGVIPVTTVLLGLANMAIMLTGLTALTAAFMAVAPHVAKLADSGTVFKVMGIMTVLGALGTVLTIFAGIAGVVPIPVVLAGLANMALVLGGVTGLITAFGALSQIKGFTEFIETGGAILTKIFNIIGEVAGSLVGGFGEGLTNSLPAIGKNLADFGNNIKPLFNAMSGVDMGGVGAFFTSLVGLLGIATGNEIVEGIKSFFGGEDESALSKLGTDLSTFSKNAQTFFTTVATYPEKGFTNAGLLFKSLADIGNVPNTGGIAQWFSGTNDFAALATGLKQLEGTKSFYDVVSTIPQAGFDNAAALFQSLADIGNIPNTGGVGQWFSGENDFTGLATKLPPFGKAMADFYNNISGIEDFSKISQLFDALANIGKVPNEGGVWQGITNFFGGEDGFDKIGTQLKTFGEQTKDFFAQVNQLNVGKLNDLWDSLKKPKEITTDISTVVSDTINEIVAKVSELPQKMGESIKQSGSSLSTALVQIWKDAVTATAAPANKLIDGANWILKEFGSTKQVAAWTPYAKGTDGHRGGNALVNDGRGAELVQMPNGKTFIPQGKNVFLPNAPKGMKVLSAEQTAKAMGRRTPTFKYADGTGNIDIWNYMDNAAGLISSVMNKHVNYNGVNGVAAHFSKGLVSTVSEQMTNWAKKLFDEFGALSLEAYDPSKGVSQWKTTVIKALRMEGQYSGANLLRTLFQMQTESGGNPRAINLWDSNAKKGIPSKGLMQVIDPTFRAYARAGFNKNIYDPLSNILASIRYAVSRYGSLGKAYRGVGYANGGIATKPSIFGEAGAEMAIPLTSDKRKRALSLWAQTGSMLGLTARTPESTATRTQAQSVEYNTYAPEFNLTINGTDNDRTLERKVKNWISEAMNEVFESAARRNPRVREV